MLHKLYIMYTTELYIYMKWLSNKGPYHPEKKKHIKNGELPLQNPPHREGFCLWTKAYVSFNVQEKPG